MNRPVRSRMQGGVGAGGEKLPATRFRPCLYKGIRVNHMKLYKL